MFNVKFVAVSKDDKFSIDNNTILKFLSEYPKYSEHVSFCNFINTNHVNLTTIYNKKIEELKDNADFIVLMHSDVKFNIADFLKHLNEVKDKYDVIGLCGCAKFLVSESPLNWFCGSKKYPESRWGCVNHGELNQVSYFSSHSPNIHDAAVGCIDGLCIILSKHAIESGLRFDEQFKFDQYDTDLSLQAILKYNLRLGVMVQTDLQHFSIGKSILSDDFLINEIALRKKWNFDIPDGKIKELAKLI